MAAAAARTLIRASLVPQVAAGGDFSLVLLEDGALLTFGESTFVSLVPPPSSAAAMRPSRLSGFGGAPIRQISAGCVSTSLFF